MVWRGHEVTAETNRRAELVREISDCGDPVKIRTLVRVAGATHVAIGALERNDFAEESRAAVRRAGEVVLDEDGGVVVRFDIGSELILQGVGLEGDDG